MCGQWERRWWAGRWWNPPAFPPEWDEVQISEYLDQVANAYLLRVN